MALDVEVAPLLKGDVRIVEMQLDRPRGRVRIGKGGSVDWLDGPRALTLPASDVSIERLTILEGNLSIEDAERGGTIALTGIDAELTAATLAGPWSGEGSFTYAGERYEASGTTGNLKREDGTARIASRLSISPRSLPYTLTATGPISIIDSDPSFDGTFTIEPRRPPEGEVPRGPDPLPITVDGGLRLTREKLTLPAFIARVGTGDDPYRLEGAGEAFFEGVERYNLRLVGAQVDVDRVATAEGGPAGLDRRLGAVAEILREVPLPAVPGRITVELPAVVAGDTVIRELEADIRPLADRSGWRVEEFVATLPGRTLLEASGQLAVPRAPGAALGFEGRMLLASRQPSGFGAWLAADVDDAIRRLDTAGFEADVKFDAQTAKFDGLELRLGEDRLTGTLARLAANGERRPRILANLEGTAIDVDTARALFDLFAGGAGEGELAAHDLDLRLEVDAASAGGVTARGVDLVMLYEGTDLAVDRLSVDAVEGVALDLSGRVETVYTRPEGRMMGSVAVEDAVAMMAALDRRQLVPSLLAQFSREPALLDGTRLELVLDASATGVETTIELDLEGNLATTRTRALMRYEGELGTPEPTVELALDAANDNPITLLRQLGTRPDPVDLAGPAELAVRIAGKPGAFAAEMSLTSPDGRIETEGRTRYVAGQGDLYEGRIELASDNLDPIFLAADLAVPGIGSGTSAKLAGNLTADAERIGLDGLRGSVRGNELSGSLVLDLDTEPRPRVDGSLDFASFDLLTLARLVFGPGFDPAESEDVASLGEPVLRGLDGDILVRAERAELGLGLLPADAARDLKAELVVNDGNIEIAGVQADWLGGAIAGSVTLAKAGTNGVVGADLRLDGASLAETGLLASEAPRASGTFDLTLAVEAQAETGAELVNVLSGGATLQLRDARLRGFEPEAFPELLARADALEDAVLERRASIVARQTLLGGAAPLADTAIPFTIANGVARATGIPLELQGVEATADLRLDLAEGEVEGNLRGTLKVPEGAAPVEGVEPDFRIDFQGDRARQTATLDATTLTTYLATRLRERREREFEAQRAAILERRRLVQAMRLSREREKRGLEEIRRRLAPATQTAGEELPG